MPSNGRPRALFENTTSDDESDEWNRLQTKINARRQQQQQQRQPHSDCSVSSKNSSSSGSSSGSSSSGCNNKNKKEDKGGGCVTGKISIGNAPQIVEHQNQQQQRSMEQQHSVVPSTIVVVAQHQPSAPQNTGAPPPRPPSIAAAVSTLAVATSAKITAITTSAPPPIRSEHPSGASRNCSNVVRTANHHPTPGGFCNTAPSSNNTLGTDANRDDDEEEDNNSAFDTELAAIPFLPPTTHASIQDKNPPRSIPRSAPPSSEAGPDPFLDDSSFQFPGFTEEDLAAMEIPENISMKNEAIIAFPASKPSADGRVQKKGAARSAFFATKSRANSPPVRQEEVLNEKDPLESYPSYAIGSGSRPENIQRDAMITSCSGTSKNNTSHDGAYLQCNSDGAHPIEVHDDTCACEYEVASKSDDWYTEDLLLPGIVNPSQDTQRRSNTSNVDAFGFEIESAPSNPTVNGDWMPARPEDMREIKESGPREHDALTETVSSVVPLFDHAFDVDVAFGFQSDPPDDGIIPTKDFVTNQSFEVNPSHFSSTPWDVAIEPIVHNFTTRNRPSAVRKHIPVTDVFDAPVANFWKTKFQTFNQLQSEMVNMLAYSDDHVVVGAPTGAGKTAVFEQAIARFLTVDLQMFPPAKGNTAQISKCRKMVYVSPSKALIEERYADWSKCLAGLKLGIEIAVVTGDGDPADSYSDLASAHFILTTPEKWDSLTRRWTENFFLFASVKLFMVDEVHLLADESRGCCLEAIVCRMKAIQSVARQIQTSQEDLSRSSYVTTTPDAINALLRFVAVSATLPNISDIATFFEANEAHCFDESYRPVPLTTRIIGQGKIGDSSKDRYFFWQNLDRNVPEIIIRFSNRRPTIVFCHSKLDCEKLADLLAVTRNISCRDADTSALASRTRVSKLQRVLLHGIGYHHAGVEVEDRRLVERSFLSGKLRVICATSTLAMGVNLPAHLVVIKGTSAWRGSGEGGGYQDIDQASLLQMIGRAGRSGFDSSGTAVIMTDNESKSRFEKLTSSGLDPVKSQVKGDRLVEAFNANVSQRIIFSTESAITWIKSSLYFVQLVKNPEVHGLKIVSNYSFDTHLMSLCKGVIDKLRSIQALEIADGQAIYPLPASHIMSHRLVEYRAMQQIASIPFDATQCQVLKALAAIEGLQRPVRRSEKKALNAAHKRLRLYKLDGPLSKARVQEPWEKSYVLLQAFIEELELEGNDFTLRQEMISIVDYATRMLSAIEEYSAKGSKHGNIAVQSLKIRRSLAVRLWSSNDGVLRQIKGIGKDVVFSLRLSGISSFEDVVKCSESQVEGAAKRTAPFGVDLRKACISILQNRLKISASIEAGNSTLSKLVCELDGHNSIGSTENDKSGPSASVTYTLIAYTDQIGGIVLYKENIVGAGTHTAQLSSSFGKLTVRLIASIIGLDDSAELKGTNGSTPLQSSIVHSLDSGNSQQNQLSNSNRMKTMDSSNRTIQAVLRPKATVSDKANSVSTFSRTHHKSHPRNSIVRQHAAHTATITPPPPQPRASELSSENLRAATNSPLPSISHISVTPRISLLSHCHTRESRAMNDVQQIQNVHKVMPPTLPFVRVAPSKRLSENGNSYDGARFSNNVESWKRQKNKQQTAQERGFVHKKHNPFSLYKHDPNDTESYLDHLSLRNKETDNESSIPREGLHALVTSSSLQRRRSVQVGTVTASQHHRQHRAGNLESRQREGQLTQTHEVLMQDRAEHNNLRDSAWSNIPNHSVEQTRQFYSVNQPYDSSLCIREPHAGSANLSSRNHEKLYNSPYSHVQHPAQYHEMMFPTQTFPPYTLNTAPRESYQIPHVHEPTWQKQQASWEDMYHGVPQPYGSTSYNGHVTGHPMYSMNNHNIGNAIGYQQTNPYHEMEFADFDEPFI